MMLRLVYSFVFFAVMQPVFSQKINESTNATTALKTILQVKTVKDSIRLILSVKDGAYFTKRFKGTINSYYQPAQVFVVTTSKKQVEELIKESLVEFADILRQPEEELTTGSLDITLNKLNYVHHVYPYLKGEGIKASMKEQQFDSTDIDFSGRYFNSGVAAATSSTHAAIMATMLGGGGNSTPSAVGAAPGALLTSSSFTSLHPDADAVYRQHQITIQSHSYGTDIENYYGADAQAYDVSAVQNPTLLHVFSSGNRGASTPADGTYAGIGGFANLTGSFKMAKNILTVGAVDSFNNIMPLSSKGPAYDGRIKPELVAFGQDGSSGAAALVAGAAALLQQAYQNVKNNLPSAALVKAVLINSADDKGEKEVDFTYGYGSLNAYKGINTIVQQQFIESNVAKNNLKHFTVTVPQGVAQLKITLAWPDVPANAGAAKALVNDLDAELTHNGETWLPWVLKHAASKSLLQQPARRAKDTLNNVEQITLQNPVAGVYTLTIDGSKLTTATQDFAIAYQFDTAQTFVFTYPVNSQPVPAGTNQLLRWQTTFTEQAVLEYSLNGGSWQPIATAALQKEGQTFSVPNVSGKMLLRATLLQSNVSFLSDTIVVIPEIKLHVGLNCADSFLLYWPKVEAAQYQLYSLRQRYMEPFLVTTDTSVVLYKRNQPGLHFAVAPMFENKAGYRSATINYTLQGVSCYFRSFLAFNETSRVRLQLQLGSLYNIKKIEYQVLNSQKGFETFFTETAPAALSLQVFHEAAQQGVNLYRAVITTTSGALVYTPVETVYFFTELPVIIYPNPAKQNEPIKIIAQEPDVYFIQVIDAAGRIILNYKLEDITQAIPPLRLSKGVYIIRFWSDENKYKTQKLVVY